MESRARALEGKVPSREMEKLDGFPAARKPDWSSGSDGDGDEEDDQHGQVYVVTEASKSAPDYLPGAEHWRSVHCAFGSLRCR
jgi:hypothetical protein